MIKRIATIVLCAVCGACGSTPSAPSSATATANLSGTWIADHASTSVALRLTQTNAAITGTVTVVDPADALYGSGVDGTVTGAIANGVFTYAFSFAALRVAGCTESDAGQLTIGSATTMTGTNVETNSCRPSVTSTITFLKQ